MKLENPITPKHVFLADDDSDDRSMFADALSEIDASVVLTEAEDGKVLMEILHLSPDPLPEVIFLDLNMPVLGGFECLEQIRNQDGALRKLNIVILSTSSNPENIERAYMMGASFYAVKPNSYEGLKKLLRAILATDWNSLPVAVERKFMLT